MIYIDNCELISCTNNWLLYNEGKKIIQFTVKFLLVFNAFIVKLLFCYNSCCLLSRYDYENVDIDAACEMMEDLEIMIADKSFVKQRFAVEDKIYQVEKADNFEYTDPVDSTITRNQVHDTHQALFL